MQIRNLRDIAHHDGFSSKEVGSSDDEDLKQLEHTLINNGPSRWHRHLENDLQFLYSKAYYGVLNRNVPHKLMCLGAWPIGSGTVRRYGLIGASVAWGGSVSLQEHSRESRALLWLCGHLHPCSYIQGKYPFISEMTAFPHGRAIHTDHSGSLLML